MLIYNVFGRHIGVQRQGERWRIFRVDLNERKFSPLAGIIIPDDLAEYGLNALTGTKLAISKLLHCSRHSAGRYYHSNLQDIQDIQDFGRYKVRLFYQYLL